MDRWEWRSSVGCWGRLEGLGFTLGWKGEFSSRENLFREIVVDFRTSFNFIFILFFFFSNWPYEYSFNRSPFPISPTIGSRSTEIRCCSLLPSLFCLSLSRFHYFLRRGKTSESRASPPTRFRCMFQLNVTKDDDPRRNADFRIFTREPGSGILRS